MKPLVLALLICLPVLSQTTNTGTVLGLVTDPTGATVPGATVQLRDAATGVARTVATNIAGRYVFVGVPPGSYSVKVTAQGFQQTILPSVAVEVGKSYTVDIELKVGEARQTVEVTGTPGAEILSNRRNIGERLGFLGSVVHGKAIGFSVWWQDRVTVAPIRSGSCVTSASES